MWIVDPEMNNEFQELQAYMKNIQKVPTYRGMLHEW